ncbi:MAG: TRAP transporter small permease [Acidobacteria bacterium]|nr:MAG: TRAP transporter small permease [Acidobacteriota bacterium]REK11526.1 MAG: TRAP transporter small permease [Acidobacteriota bacterium]
MRRWLTLQSKLEEGLLAYGILAIALLMVLGVLTRSLLGFSLTFAEEVSQFLIVMICFVGLSYAAGRRRHIRMTALVEGVGGRARTALEVLVSASTALLLLLAAAWSVRYVLVMADLGSISPVLSVPLYMVYAVAPLGLLLAAAHYVGQVRAMLRDGADAVLARYAGNLPAEGAALAEAVPTPPEMASSGDDASDEAPR